VVRITQAVAIVTPLRDQEFGRNAMTLSNRPAFLVAPAPATWLGRQCQKPPVFKAALRGQGTGAAKPPDRMRIH